MNIAHRAISVVRYSEMFSQLAMTSLAPSSQNTPQNVTAAIPSAVLVGALRGRSRR
jgi:hypothetical protein